MFYRYCFFIAARAETLFMFGNCSKTELQVQTEYSSDILAMEELCSPRAAPPLVYQLSAIIYRRSIKMDPWQGRAKSILLHLWQLDGAFA